jgi:4-hydroxythreonine-4-phosphate dehydrogenase
MNAVPSGDSGKRPIIALTQGDPAGVGPEVALKAVAQGQPPHDFVPLLVAERAALEPLRQSLDLQSDSVLYLDAPPTRATLADLHGRVPVFDPMSEDRVIEPGCSGAADALGALASLDVALDLARAGVVDAMVTAPVGKASIAEHCLSSFRGHTDYLATRCGLESYGRDYLMAFLLPRLQVALLNVHLPLTEAIAGVQEDAVVEALRCLDRHAGGKIAVAGLNPHAGEGGLLGDEDERIVRPAVERAHADGLDVHGPESPDSVFSRAMRDEFDWVLALYHDQGLIAVKTAGFGRSVNWTLGLPVLRTSVDHGTALDIAGRGIADAGPFRAAIEATLGLLRGDLPYRRGAV